MLRRRFAFAFAGLLALTALCLQPAFADDLSVTEMPGPVDEGIVHGGAPGAVCADGSCAGGGGVAGVGAFGHPLTCLPRDYLNPHLFYNFYVGGNCGSIPAGMYPSPMPTPPLVGHTYYTYQPLLPHEYMYAHHRVYHYHYNHNRGLSRTRVIYAW